MCHTEMFIHSFVQSHLMHKCNGWLLWKWMVDVPSDFQGSPMVSAICAWLVAMLPPPEHARFLEEDGKRAWRWSMTQLEKLMEVCLRCHAENTLAAAFFIFQPVSSGQVAKAKGFGVQTCQPSLLAGLFTLWPGLKHLE